MVTHTQKDKYGMYIRQIWYVFALCLYVHVNCLVIDEQATICITTDVRLRIRDQWGEMDLVM